jgi:ribosome-binding protein aMBF1 (putative translation factor)
MIATTSQVHHPNWKEVRSRLLQDAAVQQAYTDLEPRFAVIRQLIKLREERGWTQRDLAEHAQMKQPQLARLETGQTQPKIETLQRLAEAMGVDLTVRFEERTHSGGGTAPKELALC